MSSPLLVARLVELLRPPIPRHRSLRELRAARVVLLVSALIALSCSDDAAERVPTAPAERTGSVKLRLDEDSDGMDDAWEETHFGDLSQGPDGDFDSDGMTNLEEFTYGLDPGMNDAFDDADFDRYPNVFEIRGGSDPTSASSTPDPTYTVSGQGGGTHTTIGAAVGDADVSTNGPYQIIAVAPGIYTGSDNFGTIESTKPKLLIIGLEGAAKTIFDAQLLRSGWVIQNSAVIASITMRRAKNPNGAFYVSSGGEVRFVDLIVRDNVATSIAAAVHVDTAAKVQIVGSTFVDNVGLNGAQIWMGAPVAGAIVNTVVTGAATSTTRVLKDTGATLTINHSFVKSQDISGFGSNNLAGSTNPKLRSDYRLRSDSPLRGAGGAVTQSRIDMDGEPRPSSAPDIGVDQFYDSDSDDLPDWFEIAKTGNLTTLTGSGDEDSDNLTNLQEYDLETAYDNPDTDKDLLRDGEEVALGKNPLVADADDLSLDLNSDGVIDSLGVQLGHQPSATDSDGDGVSNEDELLMCTNPVRADTDGDGEPDGTDVFPHDPLMSALPNEPSDETAPVITLTSPWYAVEQ